MFDCTCCECSGESVSCSAGIHPVQIQLLVTARVTQESFHVPSNFPATCPVCTPHDPWSLVVFAARVLRMGIDLWNSAGRRPRSAASADRRRAHRTPRSELRPCSAHHQQPGRFFLDSLGRSWRLPRHRLQGRLRNPGTDDYAGLGYFAGAALRTAAGHGAADRISASPYVHGERELRNPDNAGRSRGHRRNARRGPHQQHGHDHRLHAGCLHDARHAAHARRPPAQLADRWRGDSQHQHRQQPCSADRSQGHRLHRDPAWQLHRGRRRPHLWRLQRRSAQRLRAQPRGRARTERRQLPPDQRPAELRRPHGEVRLLRQRQRQPQRLRSCAAHRPGLPRRRQRLRRLRFAHLQPHAQGPAASDLDGARGLFPDSLRPQPQRLREPAVQLQRPARRPA